MGYLGGFLAATAKPGSTEDLQKLIEKRIAAYIEAQRRLGVANAAAMLVDTQTMEGLAHLTSVSEDSGRVPH